MTLSRDEVDALEAQGASFERMTDPSDPRFEIVTLRRVAVVHYGGPAIPDVRLSGLEARRSFSKFALASACGVARFWGRDEKLARSLEKLAMRMGLLEPS